MGNKTVIILGSSRKNGNTTKIVDEISKEHGIEVINLSDFNISYYDYESKNREDDFFPLIKGIIENYDTLIFATPIYWYNMSGIMKVFFDRFSDLIRIEKETGRKLRGKKIGVISNSHDDEIEESFYIPFKKSADYLGMEYLGHAHFNANILNQTTKIELTFI
ncbi:MULTISPECIES: flavodoxin family protein [Flavobacterium]|jgi:multimeric flavodoxin WrbA|uniref:Multimeric flavodoxin WrbA n=1 Tax=Flavobacterium pectinovorum TaxID=29533 RepID=A0AB36P271_9FLAO|nr:MULTISPECIES: flavodoxin family protein [Flavobacterium]KIQ21287.1 FMN reductase [Flavobacterium sp. MEB061]OXB05590.1 NADPH-dependent oxidoreductase [Flavobacterium pectinovorum]WKL46874.1 flavodoxin family protein [Flavobacterium pectinovorum]SHM02220.1 Multimeric flavodoxin WrbA [Flavobacterium pectinovorum]